MYILSNTLLFLVGKKCENILQCKGFSHFFNKNNSVFVIFKFDINEALTNDVVNFEQPVPEFHPKIDDEENAFLRFNFIAGGRIVCYSNVEVV